MKIHQLKVEFNAEQDRLLLRVSTDTGSEILFWLTRRCTKLLWPLLLKIAESSPKIALQVGAEARNAMLGMTHEKALADADFKTPYNQDGLKSHPLGAEPVLVARMSTTRSPEGHYVLSLLPLTGQGLNLNLDSKLLHAITRLIQNGVASAQWDLPLAVPTVLSPADTEGASRLIN